MSNVQYPFLQSVKIVNKGTATGEVFIPHVLSCAYIETLDLSGTKLILTLADQSLAYRDDLGIRIDTQLDLTLADLSGGDEELWLDSFVVAKASSTEGKSGSNLKLECVQRHCAALHELAAVPMFINNKKPAEVLKVLLPDFDIECDDFPATGSYYLNAGGTKSRLIRNLMRDHGAICYFCRGKLYFKSIESLISAPSKFELKYNAPFSQHGIVSYKLLGKEAIYSRIVEKNYMSWNCVTGLSKSKTDSEKCPVLISTPTPAALDNQRKTTVPIIEAQLYGFGGYQPAVAVGFSCYKRMPEVQTDESIPAKMLISQVTHYQQGMRYLCKIELSADNVQTNAN